MSSASSAASDSSSSEPFFLEDTTAPITYATDDEPHKSRRLVMGLTNRLIVSLFEALVAWEAWGSHTDKRILLQSRCLFYAS